MGQGRPHQGIRPAGSCGPCQAPACPSSKRPRRPPEPSGGPAHEGKLTDPDKQLSTSTLVPSAAGSPWQQTHRVHSFCKELEIPKPSPGVGAQRGSSDVLAGLGGQSRGCPSLHPQTSGRPRRSLSPRSRFFPTRGRTDARP
uniref:Uncharacterized protein n=1 Tax=Myotis myotis TaxID=51298 RepID=A0A7J7SRJ9_MYOMY|nr:hypothetical protein mMyoMyo1_009429 [Myotis myotis]